MKQTQGSEQASSSYSYMAIKVALVLAILSIAVNSYVLWNVYSRNGEADNLTIDMVDNLTEVMGKQIDDLRQQLITLDHNLHSLVANDQQIEEIALLQADLNEIQNALVAEQATAEEIKIMLEALNQSIDAKYATIIDQMENMESRLTEQINIEIAQHLQLEQPTNDIVEITVQRGDSIWALASRFENPPSNDFIEQIVRENNLSDPSFLRIGQTIIIPENSY